MQDVYDVLKIETCGMRFYNGGQIGAGMCNL